MLLLSMTVILFGFIFYFVNVDLPKPGPQPLNQFDASLSYSGSTVSGISILHLSGTTISGTSSAQASIYIFSQKHPTAIPNPFTLAQGLPMSATVWSFGQTWTLSLSTYGITAPDNLTVSVISSGQLEYESTLLVSVATFAPYFGSIQVTPAGTIGGATAFTVTVPVTFATSSGNTVTINTTEFPSGGVHAMTLGSGTTYTYSGTTPSPSSTTTYYLFLVATDGNHRVTVVSLPVTVS
jgi:hypothetical protein